MLGAELLRRSHCTSARPSSHEAPAHRTSVLSAAFEPIRRIARGPSARPVRQSVPVHRTQFLATLKDHYS